MTERPTLSSRDIAQVIFEHAGHGGFVEDFIEKGSSDLGFLGMKEPEQELWLSIVEKFPSLLDIPPLFE